MLSTSHAAATSAGDPFGCTPSAAARSGVRDGLQATTGMPKARARPSTSCPMRPSPTSPSVRPNRPRALLYSALFQRPALRSAALAGMRRSSASISAKVSSATAMEFLPGQLDT